MITRSSMKDLWGVMESNGSTFTSPTPAHCVLFAISETMELAEAYRSGVGVDKERQDVVVMTRSVGDIIEEDGEIVLLSELKQLLSNIMVFAMGSDTEYHFFSLRDSLEKIASMVTEDRVRIIEYAPDESINPYISIANLVDSLIMVTGGNGYARTNPEDKAELNVLSQINDIFNSHSFIASKWPSDDTAKCISVAIECLRFSLNTGLGLFNRSISADIMFASRVAILLDITISEADNDIADFFERKIDKFGGDCAAAQEILNSWRGNR